MLIYSRFICFVLLFYMGYVPFGSTKKWLIIKQLSAILVLLTN